LWDSVRQPAFERGLVGDTDAAQGVAQVMPHQIMLVRTAKWSWLKAWAMKIARHRGMKKAIVALARRLAVIMHRIWVDGTEFRWTREVTAA
jgi:hypothetical protein